MCSAKNVGVVGYGEAFCKLHMQFAIGEIDKSRCVSYFSTDPLEAGQIKYLEKERQEDEYF